jgi:uncharacterized protein
MKLQHSFNVPVPPDEAWPVLMDVRRIAPCMPGATLEEVDGDEFRGRVRVKAGPITVSYQGSARFAEVDVDGRRVVMEASGKEPRGSGSVKATITAALDADAGGTSRVDVTTDLAITGKPAQFGRGLLEDIGGRIIGQFADNLALEIKDGPEPVPGGESAATAATAPSEAERAVRATSSAEAPSTRPAASASLDLLPTLGPVLAKRAAPVLGGLVLLLVLVRLLRR